MKQLIKITHKNNILIVSARELHKFLQIKTDFSHWIKRNIENNFYENQDFTLIYLKSKGKKPLKDYALILETAKAISILQRNEKGKIAWRYLTETEKVVIKKIEKVEIGKSVVDIKQKELLEYIKGYLKRGDLGLISNEIGVRYDSVKKVLQGKEISKKILDALYKKALENKSTGLFTYQKLIDNLKS